MANFRSGSKDLHHWNGPRRRRRRRRHLPPGDAPNLGPIVCHPSPTTAGTTLPTSSSSTSSSSRTISRNCPVDSQTGTITSGCCGGKKLRPVELSARAWTDMMYMNETIVLQGRLEGDTSEYQGGGKGLKRSHRHPHHHPHPNSDDKNNKKGGNAAGDRRRRDWDAFKRYLERRVGPPHGNSDRNSNSSTAATAATNAESANGHSSASPPAQRSTRPTSTTIPPRSPYDVVIDGANVGYYKQNYANAPKHVNYEQINWVVLHYVERSKSVLLVLHERHFHPNLMPSWAKPIVQSWEDNMGGGVDLYRTPSGSNDDWFWLYAALWCGRDTLVLTNDEMRDHHFQMLGHRHFTRWRERNQVRFAFGEWYDDDDADAADAAARGGGGRRRRRVELSHPEVYSRRIQRLDEQSLVVPLAKRGDTNRFMDGRHDADDGTAPAEETYVCIKMCREGAPHK